MTAPDQQLLMSGDAHYREAERLLAVAHHESYKEVEVVISGPNAYFGRQTPVVSPLRQGSDPATAPKLRALATIHSQLALASATWSSAVLNDATHNVTVNVAERARSRGWGRRA